MVHVYLMSINVCGFIYNSFNMQLFVATQNTYAAQAIHSLATNSEKDYTQHFRYINF
jgi:hypothetical protein